MAQSAKNSLYKGVGPSSGPQRSHKSRDWQCVSAISAGKKRDKFTGQQASLIRIQEEWGFYENDGAFSEARVPETLKLPKLA